REREKSQFFPLPKGFPHFPCENTIKQKFCNKEEINASIKKQLPPKKFYQPFAKGFKATPQDPRGQRGKAPAHYCFVR
ncbi:MAG: hypothetical protein ACI4XA_07345, partial [Oscillospiraceae bacterium]